MTDFSLDLSPLPPDVQRICKAVAAPPRLVAHLTLVHDVALKLVSEIRRCFPDLRFDEESVTFGAATHDIGKALHPEELSQAGSLHEREGEGLLASYGIIAEMARFTRTHAAWNADKSLALEDLLVSLADTCWKGKRVIELEERIAGMMAADCARELWEVFSVMDDIICRLALNADDRLAWQAQHPV